MTDFHTHILPEIDDGSRSMDETREMFRMEHDQGIRRVIATPHFYANEDFPHAFLERRADRMGKVKEMMMTEEWGREMQVLAGAEVYYFNGMADSAELPELCIEGTSILLLELPFAQWNREVLREVKKIVEKRKLTVILAHIERYYKYQKNMEIWEHVFEFPVYAQMNAEAFLSWQSRRTALKLLKKGYRVILGSDCHGVESRIPNLKAGRDVIREKAGKEMLDRIDQAGEQLL